MFKQICGFLHVASLVVIDFQLALQFISFKKIVILVSLVKLLCIFLDNGSEVINRLKIVIT